MQFLSVSEAAREAGVSAAALSRWFYRGTIDGTEAPVICGSRMIPRSFLPVIVAKAAELSERAAKRKQMEEVGHV